MLLFLRWPSFDRNRRPCHACADNAYQGDTEVPVLPINAESNACHFWRIL